MLTLFDRDDTEAGFRLRYVEIYNWGTFGKSIWRLTPNGKNSLLTGANSSGKTTIVDALITLLVPHNKRHYNLSSGTEKKRERDEKSYCLGAHRTVQQENERSAKTEYLRDKNEYSILLACFSNQGIKQDFTLAQVRWFSNDDLKKAFLVSPNSLTIQDHFAPIDPKGEWKKRVKRLNNAEVFDAFTQYSRRFMRFFGLRSEKALSLFSQTVGVKVLGDLNEFIRTNMLEETDVEEKFRKLRENYKDLDSAYKAVEKDRDQIKLLAPIVKNGEQFQCVIGEIQELDETLKIIPAYFSQEQIRLLEEALTRKRQALEQVTHTIESLKNDLEKLHNRERDLDFAIRENEVGKQIERISREIRDLEERRHAKEESAKKYNAIAAKLGCPADPDEQSFYESLQAANLKRTEIEEKLPILDEQWADARNAKQVTEAEIERLTRELTSLQSRHNQIPLDSINMRKKILDALHINEGTMPFVGELLKVKEQEKAWEGAIERLLRGFGLTLLVPEAYYRQVNRYVKHTDLKGRIVYYRVEKESLNFQQDFSNSVCSKVET